VREPWLLQVPLQEQEQLVQERQPSVLQVLQVQPPSARQASATAQAVPKPTSSSLRVPRQLPQRSSPN
jgi:hypothetical protein